MILRRFATTTFVVTATAALLLFVVNPANAHGKTVHEGSDYASVGADHHRVEVCDMERDGNGVYADFFHYGGGGHTKVRDSNGSAGGCGSTTLPGFIVHFRICEDDFGSDTCRYSGVHDGW